LSCIIRSTNTDQDVTSRTSIDQQPPGKYGSFRSEIVESWDESFSLAPRRAGRERWHCKWCFSPGGFGGVCPVLLSGIFPLPEGYAYTWGGGRGALEWLESIEDEYCTARTAYISGAKRITDSYCTFGIDTEEDNILLRKCIRICFRGIVTHCCKSTQVELLSALLKLQREYVPAIEVLLQIFTL
uniref:Protein transport protein SEC23 n=1 Tax=Gongylonema pulchrum TaxID=637853 RepID=A0A183D340_9BILA